MSPRLSLLLVLVGGLACTPRSGPLPVQKARVLEFWAGPEAKEKLPPEVIRDHAACSGQVARVEVTKVPALDDKVFEPEAVVEFDQQARVVCEWGMPVDGYVAGIADDEIIVGPPPDYATTRKEWLYIKPDGAFRIADFTERAPSEEPEIACPDLARFAGSAFVRCFAFQDRPRGKSRRISYQGPCT